MKFLIDAQLPRRLAQRLRAAGHDAIHTLDLPAGNRTTDAEICRIADSDGCAVVTKDADFVSSLLLGRKPRRLVLVSVGNTTNDDFEQENAPFPPVRVPRQLRGLSHDVLTEPICERRVIWRIPKEEQASLPIRRLERVKCERNSVKFHRMETVRKAGSFR